MWLRKEPHAKALLLRWPVYEPPGYFMEFFP